MTRDYSGSLDDRATAYDDWLLAEAESYQDGEPDDFTICRRCGDSSGPKCDCQQCLLCGDWLHWLGPVVRVCDDCCKSQTEDFRTSMTLAASAYRAIRRACSRCLPISLERCREYLKYRDDARDTAQAMGWIK